MKRTKEKYLDTGKIEKVVGFSNSRKQEFYD